MDFISTDKAPAAIGPYSQATVAGNLVFCSGQIPIVPATGQLLEGDTAAQAKLVMSNMAAVLAAAGCGLNDVVKTTIFLASMDDFGAVNAVYAEAFGDHRPARATVEVSRLPKSVAVEIDCIAVKP